MRKLSSRNAFVNAVVIVGGMLVASGCATVADVQRAQSTADAALAQSDEAMTTAHDAGSAAESARQAAADADNAAREAARVADEANAAAQAATERQERLETEAVVFARGERG